VVNELNHRVKNSLAVVQSLAVQTIRRGSDADLALEAFVGRLQTLARAHDLLTDAGWEGADLRRLIERSLEPLAGPHRYRCSGPEVVLPSETAVSLAMVLHELATNALKYGALSVTTGHVSLDWQVREDELSLTWAEVGGPTVSPPVRRGFGTRLIAKALTGSRSSAADFAPSGLRWTCVIALSAPRPLHLDPAAAAEEGTLA
jgi:two-component sensor histidine kinase